MSRIQLNEQLYILIKRRISNKEYPSGTQLPPEVKFARQLKVSRNTLRSVMRRLEEEQLVVRIPSKGTFVMPYWEGEQQYDKRFLVLCQRDTNYYYPCHYILPGMAREAAVRGCKLEICDLSLLSSYTPAELHDFLSSTHISGIIIIASNFVPGDRLIELINTQKIPVCQVHGRPEDYNFTNWALLYCNTRGGWMEALRYLASQGHQQVVVTNFQNPIGEVRRYPREDFFNLLKELSLDNSGHLLVDFPPYDHDALKARLLTIFSRSRKRPTAVLCFSDHQAPVVYDVLKTLNLKIPQDVAVMGFCGIPDSKYMHPALSTVDLNYQSLGAKAIDIMLEADNWYPQQRPLIEHEFTLLERASTSRQ